MPKKGKYVKFKNYGRKIKSPFIIDANLVFQCQKIMKSKIQKILIRKNIINIMLVVMATNQYVLNKSSFINSMIEENKYCSDVMKKKFNKELVMTNEDNENFKNSTKCWINLKY